jgi:hypothetical protein
MDLEFEGGTRVGKNRIRLLRSQLAFPLRVSMGCEYCRTPWSRTRNKNHLSRCPGVTYSFSGRSLLDKFVQVFTVLPKHVLANRSSRSSEVKTPTTSYLQFANRKMGAHASERLPSKTWCVEYERVMRNPNFQLLVDAAKLLQSILDELVFVGGSNYHRRSGRGRARCWTCGALIVHNCGRCPFRPDH